MDDILYSLNYYYVDGQRQGLIDRQAAERVCVAVVLMWLQMDLKLKNPLTHRHNSAMTTGESSIKELSVGCHHYIEY